MVCQNWQILCHIPLYQRLSPKIKQLKALGMSNDDIATKLKISRKTVNKSCSLLLKKLEKFIKMLYHLIYS